MSDTSFGRALLAVLALLVATLGPAVGLAVAAAAGGYAYDVPWTINSSLEPSAADSLDEQGIRDWAVPASDTNLGYDDHQDLLRASARLAGSRLAHDRQGSLMMWCRRVGGPVPRSAATVCTSGTT
jgi:hypothetical protein